ncbi:NAD(P)/FAD-dependent oxidoreductase [Chryseolinea sp. H1M3-3]|uniref:flavin monoamine oxidase family protein n=1 Tax=Chryseolinea sp. H1M3-3 TaxID=3034144 RepID=UPI0023EB29D6|nr:NAD(P)/FAD-dependent oxidoreductase [Chryseolinea sp. H1M3-3]
MKPDVFDIVIIGAGAAGLSAAKILSTAGRSICICEARDRIGGRIHTLKGGEFSGPVEAGAEFIHGDLPLTKALMKQAKVSYYAGKGQTWTVEKNELARGDLFDDNWDILLTKLRQLEHDITIGEFLKTFFNEPKYQSLVEGVTRFVQGYDAADVNKASALALREEWANENIQGYRPIGGYSLLVEHLWSEVNHLHGVLKLSTVINKIVWRNNYVEMYSDRNEKITARKVLVTVPVSVLKSGAIKFDPPLAQHQEALQQLEVGGVIKFLVEFKGPIWERRGPSKFNRMPALNFLFSDAFIPTWWSQRPAEIPLLTGWLAGPVVQNLPQDDNVLLSQAISSLAYVFGCETAALEKEIRAAKVFNWYVDPYAQGAYAYKTLATSTAVRVLTRPLDNTIYFAGEALYDGPEMGTVEAALASGNKAAEEIIREGFF